MDKVHEWEAALTAAANLSGWSSLDMKDESELVEKIVEGITRKLILSSNIGDDLNSLGCCFLANVREEWDKG